MQHYVHTTHIKNSWFIISFEYTVVIFFLKFIIGMEANLFKINGLLTTFLYVYTTLNSICITLLQFWLLFKSKILFIEIFLGVQ